LRLHRRNDRSFSASPALRIAGNKFGAIGVGRARGAARPLFIPRAPARGWLCGFLHFHGFANNRRLQKPHRQECLCYSTPDVPVSNHPQ
jgi:hypothetical protein